MKIFISCSSRKNVAKEYIDIAREISEFLNNKGYSLLFGACSVGMMGECYKAFSNVKSYTVDIWKEDLKNLTKSENIIVSTTMDRLKNLYLESDVILVLPGGSGSISELFSCIEENRSVSDGKKIVIYNYNGYYNFVIDCLNNSIKEKFNDESIFSNLVFVDSIDELERIL